MMIFFRSWFVDVVFTMPGLSRVFEVNIVPEWSATDVITKGISIGVFPYVYVDTAAMEEGPTKSYAWILSF